MILNIYSGDKTKYVGVEKARQGADSRPASFYWRYLQEGLGPVNF